MALLADGTITVAAREREVLAAVGFQVAWLAPTTDEFSATVRTSRAFCCGAGLPVDSATLEREICEHARPHAIPAFIQRLLNFS